MRGFKSRATRRCLVALVRWHLGPQIAAHTGRPACEADELTVLAALVAERFRPTVEQFLKRDGALDLASIMATVAGSIVSHVLGRK